MLLLMSTIISAQDSKYFDANTSFSKEIKSPGEFLAYTIGDHHTRYDRIVDYMVYLAENSERVHLEVFGQSVEKRPQVLLTITSAANFDRLEEIRIEHLKLSDPLNRENLDMNMPVVVQLGFNVHGNEASGGEASMLSAYYLAACVDEEISTILDNAVIFIEPVLNPDGRDRFVTWVNMNRSRNASTDSNDREHTEAWPGGRTNHYWFDLNRDWFPLTQQESVHRITRFHKWRPNLITDHHEMGTNSTFFFEPTKPGSENRLVPAENYSKLNQLLAAEYSEALDKINHYYDSGSSFDNSYPGYGSTYGDLNGGLAILFEQASTRGLIQKTDLGYEMHYSLGIKNQLTGAIVSVKTAVNNRQLFNSYMKRFYADAFTEARDSRIKSYVFGAADDFGRTKDFIRLLNYHQVEVYNLKSEVKADGATFTPGAAFSVPVDQAQYRIIQSVFETYKNFPDSLFYDASAWSLVHAYGLPFAALAKDESHREKGRVATIDKNINDIIPCDYGYVFSWTDYYSAKALAMLHKEGIRVRAAWEPFKMISGEKEISFSRGSVFIPVQYQEKDSNELNSLLNSIAKTCKIDIYPVSTSVSGKGPWIGSGAFRALEAPGILMITGDGVSSSNAGAIWELLDRRAGITITRIDIGRLSRVNLYNYNTLILPSGGYGAIDNATAANISRWINDGGRLLALGSSMSWLRAQKLISYETVGAEPLTERTDYNILRQSTGKHSIGGIYCRADLDITNPAGFGYSNRNIVVYKDNRSFIKMLDAPASNIVVYKEDPVINGYVSNQNREMFKDCASLIYFSKGAGSITVFIDDPVFRGTWRGTDKMLTNLIFFGSGL